MWLTFSFTKKERTYKYTHRNVLYPCVTLLWSVRNPFKQHRGCNAPGSTRRYMVLTFWPCLYFLLVTKIWPYPTKAERLGTHGRAHFRRIWRFDQYKTLDSTNIHIGRILYWSYPRPAYIQCTLDSAFEALAQIGQPRRTAFQQGNLTPKSGRHDDSRIQIFYSVHIALFFFFFFLPSSLTFISFFKETGFSS